jgi:dienelactone hydrolase
LSPDGAWLGYVSERDGTPRVWLQCLADGRELLLDTGPEPVQQVRWSVDGAWLAMLVAPGGAPRTQVWVVRPDGRDLHQVGSSPGGATFLGPWTHQPGVLAIARACAQAADGVAELEDAATGQRTLLTSGGHPIVLDLDRTNRLALVRRGPRGARSVWAVNLATGYEEQVVPGSAVGSTDLARLSPDASIAYVRSDAGGEMHALFGVKLATQDAPQRARLVAERSEAEFENVVLTADGRTALLLWNFAGKSECELMNLASGERVELPLPEPVAHDASFSHDGRWLAMTLEGPTHPKSVWLFELEVNYWRRATTHPAAGSTLAGARGSAAVSAQPNAAMSMLSDTSTPAPAAVLGRVAPSVAPPRASSSTSPPTAADAIPPPTAAETDLPPTRASVVPPPLAAEAWASWLLHPTLECLRADDGMQLTGWLYRPMASGAPGPALIHLHGGPEAQERPVFNPLFQELASRGIAVFAPNVRGSSGFGRSFVNADNLDKRWAAIGDVAACARHLIGLGVAAPDRVACGGRSYGGYLTLAALVFHPELFAAGVDICGMADFHTFYAKTEPWIAAAAYAKYGHPIHDAALLRALSPIHRFDALRAPLLVVHGANDSNVPVEEAEQVVARARERDIPVEYLLIADEGHELARLDSRELFVRTTVEWLAARL